MDFTTAIYNTTLTSGHIYNVFAGISRSNNEFYTASIMKAEATVYASTLYALEA